MKKLFLTLPENLSSAVGFTLLHSLWQGAVLLLIFAGLHFFLKSARSRYLLGMGTLLSQAALSALTFWWIYTPALSMDSAVSHSTVLLPAEILGTNSQTLLHSVQNYIAENHQKFTLLWLLGVGILLTRMGIGLVYTRHLKTASTKAAPAETQSMLLGLASAMRVKEHIPLFESFKVSSPLTVGWLKPVILFPVGMLNGLSPAQVEAILAHELAHILRKDYLWNIVQNAIETFFFFHPAVWVLSHRVRIERENCCDDIALTYCENKLVLAHALAEVATFQTKPMFAMAFGAKRYTLLDRVKRIVGMDERQALTAGNWISLTVLLSLCMGAWTYAQEPEKPAVTPRIAEIPKVSAVSKQIPAQVPIQKDTLPKSPAEEKMDRLAEDMNVLSQQMSKYSEKMSAIGSKMHNPEMDKLTEEMTALSQKMSEPSTKIGLIAEKVSILSLEIALKSMKQEETTAMEKELKQKEAELEKWNKEMEVFSAQMEVLGKKMEAAQAPIHGLSEEMSRLSSPMDSLGKLMNKKGEEMNKVGKELEKEYYEKAKVFSEELQKNGFISDKNNYEIKVYADHTTVNGQKLNSNETEKLNALIRKHYRIKGEYSELRFSNKDGKPSQQFRSEKSTFQWEN